MRTETTTTITILTRFDIDAVNRPRWSRREMFRWPVKKKTEQVLLVARTRVRAPVIYNVRGSASVRKLQGEQPIDRLLILYYNKLELNGRIEFLTLPLCVFFIVSCLPPRTYITTVIIIIIITTATSFLTFYIYLHHADDRRVRASVVC